jgi:hypothetical protein
MIGSMAPDFAYFFSHSAERLITHSVGGLFTFCLPTGLIVWLVYVRLLEEPTIALLPEPWCRRFPLTGRIDFALLVKVSVAIVVGGATHIAWDAFTHRATPVTDALPLLRVHTPGFAHLPVFVFLQGVSSVAGLAVLALWAWRKRYAAEISRADSFQVTNRLRVGVLILLVVASLAFALLYDYPHRHSRLFFQIFYLAIGGMSGWIVAWCGVAVWMRRRRLA